MSVNAGIEWTDATWNPNTGCTKVSDGCDHCYAKTMHERFNGPGSFDTVTLHSERFAMPLRWRKPRMVFVNSMSDLFHRDIPDGHIARVFSIMRRSHQHTFQILTKRHARMRALMHSAEFRELVWELDGVGGRFGAKHEHFRTWPPRNVWLGVTVENQQWADIRIPVLLDTPAALRFLSCEPLLGPIQLPPAIAPNSAGRGWNDLTRLHWVIAGGESGHHARPMLVDWARSLRDQCVTAGIPFFFKQAGSVLAREWGGRGKGTDPKNWPEQFPREYPHVDDLEHWRLAARDSRELVNDPQGADR